MITLRVRNITRARIDSVGSHQSFHVVDRLKGGAISACSAPTYMTYVVLASAIDTSGESTRASFSLVDSTLFFVILYPI